MLPFARSTPLAAALAVLAACSSPPAVVVAPVDAGPHGDCDPSAGPVACGPEASACVRACAADGSLGECQPTSGPADFQHDPKNCGGCGLVCADALHASAACAAGTCARGPCAAGWFDFDGTKTPGCEVSCQGPQCQLPDGTTVALASPPLPETGAVARTFATGSSLGAFVQTG